MDAWDTYVQANRDNVARVLWEMRMANDLPMRKQFNEWVSQYGMQEADRRMTHVLERPWSPLITFEQAAALDEAGTDMFAPQDTASLHSAGYEDYKKRMEAEQRAKEEAERQRLDAQGAPEPAKIADDENAISSAKDWFLRSMGQSSDAVRSMLDYPEHKYNEITQRQLAQNAYPDNFPSQVMTSGQQPEQLEHPEQPEQPEQPERPEQDTASLHSAGYEDYKKRMEAEQRAKEEAERQRLDAQPTTLEPASSADWFTRVLNYPENKYNEVMAQRKFDKEMQEREEFDKYVAEGKYLADHTTARQHIDDYRILKDSGVLDSGFFGRSSIFSEQPELEKIYDRYKDYNAKYNHYYQGKDINEDMLGYFHKDNPYNEMVKLTGDERGERFMQMAEHLYGRQIEAMIDKYLPSKLFGTNVEKDAKSLKNTGAMIKLDVKGDGTDIKLATKGQIRDVVSAYVKEYYRYVAFKNYLNEMGASGAIYAQSRQNGYDEEVQYAKQLLTTDIPNDMQQTLTNLNAFYNTYKGDLNMQPEVEEHGEDPQYRSGLRLDRNDDVMFYDDNWRSAALNTAAKEEARKNSPPLPNGRRPKQIPQPQQPVQGSQQGSSSIRRKIKPKTMGTQPAQE